MALKKTQTGPRDSHFMGMCEKASRGANGTWLEPESLCYPSGRMLRRALATCEDGVQRVVRCGIPDTFFSIPGYRLVNGRRVKGYVTSREDGFLFIELKTQEVKRG